MPEPIPRVSRSWTEGRYLDLWGAVHLLSGLAGGFANVYVGLRAGQVLALAAALMVAWELAEAAFGIRESRSNRVIDVAVGLAGTAAALAVAPRLGEGGRRILFVVTATAAVVGLYLGARSYRRR
jgi:hypothetical protein